jgi:hypothetical protein
MSMTIEQIRAAQKIGLSVLEAIEEAGELGAPSGVIYAALMTKGCSLPQYQSLMAPLESRGFVTLSDDCYTLNSSGRAFIQQLRKTLGHAAVAAA